MAQKQKTDSQTLNIIDVRKQKEYSVYKQEQAKKDQTPKNYEPGSYITINNEYNDEDLKTVGGDDEEPLRGIPRTENATIDLQDSQIEDLKKYNPPVESSQ